MAKKPPRHTIEYWRGWAEVLSGKPLPALRAPKGDGGIIGRWFVVDEEGGMWRFVSKAEWNRTTALIKGERIGSQMKIEDSIIQKLRKSVVSDDDLLKAGYRKPDRKAAPKRVRHK